MDITLQNNHVHITLSREEAEALHTNEQWELQSIMEATNQGMDEDEFAIELAVAKQLVIELAKLLDIKEK